MRVFLKASFDIEAGNRAVADGSLGRTIQSILADIKPEAAYFLDDGGQRTAYIFCDMKETSEIPALAEPWFLALNAKVEIHPAMNAEDLGKAAPAFERITRKYGSRTMAA
jgi:hypothetical protein